MYFFNLFFWGPQESKKSGASLLSQTQRKCIGVTSDNNNTTEYNTPTTEGN